MKKALIVVMFLMSFAGYSYANDMWINLGQKKAVQKLLWDL